MKILKWIHEFEFTASGGIAIYFLMCALYVTVEGLTGWIKFIFNWLKG